MLCLSGFDLYSRWVPLTSILTSRCLNVIGLPRDTAESLVTRRQNLARKEFKRMLESEYTLANVF